MSRSMFACVSIAMSAWAAACGTPVGSEDGSAAPTADVNLDTARDAVAETTLDAPPPGETAVRDDVAVLDVVHDAVVTIDVDPPDGAVDSGTDAPRETAADASIDAPLDAARDAVAVTDVATVDASTSDAGGVRVLRCPIRPAPAGRPPATQTPGDFTRIETLPGWDYTESCESQELCAATEGVTYEIGPGKAYENPRDVPWLNLRPCDQVLFYYRAQPYNDIVYLAARGEHGRAIVIRGVAGPNGERPVLDGNDAVMPRTTGANSYVDALGLMEIVRPLANASIRYGYHPGHLLVSGLHFRNARAPAMVTDLTGTVRAWGTFTCGIYALGVEHLTVNDCEFSDNGLGLFINSTSGAPAQSSNVLVRANYFHDNGVVSQFSQHNAYTEAIGIVYEYNYFDAPVAGSGADNLKERSAGNIFRYNYFHAGVNMISLRDPQSNRDFEAAALDSSGRRLAARTFVYGNLFSSTAQVIGRNNSDTIGVGDGPCPTGCGEVREGTLYFYGNRVYASLPQPPAMYTAQSSPLFVMLNTRSPVTVSAVNNLFFSVNLPFALFYYQGLADWHDNWIGAFQNTFAAMVTGALTTGTPFTGAGLGGLMRATGDPGFVDAAHGNYLTTATSPFAALHGTLPPEVIENALVPNDVPVVTPYGP